MSHTLPLSFLYGSPSGMKKSSDLVAARVTMDSTNDAIPINHCENCPWREAP